MGAEGEKWNKTRYGRARVSATPSRPHLGAGGGVGRAEENPTILSFVVSTACSFLQVTPSQIGHQAPLCPALTSPSACGQMRSSCVSAMPLTSSGGASWKQWHVCVSVCFCVCVCVYTCVFVCPCVWVCRYMSPYVCVCTCV